MHLSKLSYYADFFISLGLIALSMWIAAHDTWVNCAKWSTCFIAGAISWTLVEYLIHRWIYHQVPYFRQLHEVHHAEPTADIGAPPLIGIALILFLFFVPLATTSPVLASGLTAGVLGGYTTYMLVHHADHHWKPAPTSWLSRARQLHALHHHYTEHCHFGVTTSIWDQLFGTTAKTKRGGSLRDETLHAAK